MLVSIYDHPEVLHNKYINTYILIITNAQSQHRNKSNNVYYEAHHIIPKSMGGNNSFDNVVLLTAKEHYIIHHLLAKFTIGSSKQKMNYAFWMMANKTSNGKHDRHYRITSRVFDTAKQEMAKNMSERPLSSTCFKTGHVPWCTGENLSPDHIEKLRRAKLGTKQTAGRVAHRAKMNTGQKRTNETKRKMRAAQLGKKVSEETKKKLRVPQEIVTCPHCGKRGGCRTMKRWHFDKCQKKDLI